ncbi:hypothetical protein DEU56DRAFT_830798 [Suillus clintonianus]|uniref:uncharacterized protein n=1 Tax=Suillus clintonianus TaxID=1904413 RepID=UPI001B864AA8|nr:uncharacterized protein DEU56DRAFT_830798 [Suillus clintonianus]KAG2123081.1 hypothetical protein DEU56DRAFT_830798 [Suillus clintonianus]
MVSTFNELDVRLAADRNKNMHSSLLPLRRGYYCGHLVGSAPIVVPIVASVVIANWVYEVYQRPCVLLLILDREIINRSSSVTRRSSASSNTSSTYLNLVSGSQELSRRAIKLAVKSYHDSPTRGEVQYSISAEDTVYSSEK